MEILKLLPKKVLTLFVLVFLFSNIALSKTITMALTPFTKSYLIEEQFIPIVKILEMKLGSRVDLIVEPDHMKLAEDLVSGKVDIAHFTPITYVLAKKKKPEINVSFSNVANGNYYYVGYFIALKETNINSIEDIEGKRIVFTKPRSTSGFFFPLARLLEERVPLWNLPTSYYFSGGHIESIKEVFEGRADVAVVYSVLLANFKKIYPQYDKKKLRYIAKTERIPLDAYCLSNKLPSETKKIIIDTFLNMHINNRNALANMLNINAFIRTSDKGYRKVRAMIKNLESRKLRNNERLKVTAKGIINFPKFKPEEESEELETKERERIK